MQTIGNAVLDANPFRYRGYYFDNETGLYYLNSRYYDPQVGRFLNADDPTMLFETAGVAGGANLYAYCLNNPIMMIDSTGKFAVPVFKMQLLNQMTGGKGNAALLLASNIKNASLVQSKKTSKIVYDLEHSVSLFGGNTMFLGRAIGNLYVTVSTRHGNPDTFYSFTSASVSSIKNGVGVNLLGGWLGASAYYTTDYNVGIQYQFTPAFHIGGSIGLSGIGFNFGFDIGNTSIDIGGNIGIPTLAVATALLLAPEPVFTKVAAGVIIVFDWLF